MEWMNGLGTVLLGLILRFAVPVGATLLVVFWLRWLDARWQEEAEGLQAQAQSLAAKAIRCWEVMNCPPEKRATCPAYQSDTHPCWQIFRNEDGLQEKCLDCQVFRQAPAPVAIGAD